MTSVRLSTVVRKGLTDILPIRIDTGDGITVAPLVNVQPITYAVDSGRLTNTMACTIMRVQYLLAVVTWILLLMSGCASEPQPVPEAGMLSAGRTQRVDLLAMGDWGTGRDGQRIVAKALADYVRSTDAEFDGMLLAGDNFYVRLRGVEDPQWRTLFEQMYDPDVLDFPFYASLGNHDYEQDKRQVQLDYARLNPRSRWKLPSPWYRIDFPRESPLVTVFMLDSNRDLMPREHWHAQNRWLRDQLRERDKLGTWVLCVAHHPMFSNGDHGDIGPLQKTWGTLFEEHGVDFYVCGHDHDLQHLQISGWEMSFVLCGGGGAGVRPMRHDRRGPFSRSLNGFAHFTFTPQQVLVKFVDQRGEVVHAFQRARDGAVAVIDSTGSDLAQPRSIKSITRPDATTAPAR
jgi:hypothetical protein